MSYLTVLLLVVILSHSDHYGKNIQPRVKEFFFDESLMHPLLREQNQLIKHNNVDYTKLQTRLTSNIQNKDDLDKIYEEYYIPEERKGLFNKYKDVRRSTLWTLNVIDKYCDYFEKYKNLVKWEDPVMTQAFFFTLIALFIVVTFLPLRLFIALGYCYKYYKGLNWQQRRQKHNREIARIELQRLFDVLKIKIDKEPAKKTKKNAKDNENSDGLKQGTTIKLEQVEFQWERIFHPYAKKSGISLDFFQKKFVAQFQNQLKIYLPKDILKQCRSPKQLIEFFGKTPFILKQSIVHNDDEVENNPSLFKRNVPLYMYLPIFVMNRIPSDIYRVRNPMLKIKKSAKTGYRFVEPNTSIVASAPKQQQEQLATHGGSAVVYENESPLPNEDEHGQPEALLPRSTVHDPAHDIPLEDMIKLQRVGSTSQDDFNSARGSECLPQEERPATRAQTQNARE